MGHPALVAGTRLWALVLYWLFDGFHFGVLQGAGDGEGVGGRSAFHVYFAIEGDRARQRNRLLTASEQAVRYLDGALRNGRIGAPLIKVDERLGGDRQRLLRS